MGKSVLSISLIFFTGGRLKAMKATIYFTSWVFALSCLFACAHQKDSVNFSPIGSFVLVKVEGQTLPARVNHDGTSIRVVSGQLEFTEDGGAMSETVFGPPNGGDIHRRVTANYTQIGDELLLRWEGAGVTKGLLEDGSFTMENEGMTFTYVKE